MQSLISVACLSRRAQTLYANEASARVFLDGVHEMATFHRRLSPQAKRVRCHHSAPCPADNIEPAVTPPKKRLRAERIKEVSIYDMTYGGDTELPDAPAPGDVMPSIAMQRELISVTRLSNTLSVCPNLHALQVYQSSVALSPSAAYTISLRTPRLKSLTFRSPHCDAASLAGLVRRLDLLHTLDVSSVKTCPCRGHAGLVHGAIELGLALRTHPKLHRVVFNSCKVLGVDDGLLLRVLSGEDRYTCEHKEALRNRLREQHHQHYHPDHHFDHHNLASPSLMSPEGPSLRLRSIEFRRSPLHGRALLRYLRSAPAAQLNHLFIGGCKHVRPGHLILATQAVCPHSGLTSSTEPLQLEVDGRLLSKEMLRNLSHRITLLRVFEPADEHLKIIAHVLRSGGLDRLTEIVILPKEEDLPRWSPLSHNLASLLDDAEIPASSPPPTGDLRRYMQSQLALLGHRRPVDLTVGDEAWHAMQQCKLELRFWAQLQREEEQEEMLRASLSHDADDEHGEDKGTAVDWSGGGIDVWR